MSGTRDTVRAIVDGAVTLAGFDLEDLTVTATGRRRQVKVVVDRDGGVLLDDAAHLSRQISEALDEDGVMGETAYVLEVTSPGVDRPLTLPRHWRRNLGRLVRIERPELDDVVGRIESVDEAAGVVTLTMEPDQRELECRLAEIARATIQIEFSRRGAAADEDTSTLDEAAADVADPASTD